MRKPVFVGQVCWLSGGFHHDLSGRLVKVTKIGTRKYTCIEVVLLNKQEFDHLVTNKGKIRLLALITCLLLQRSILVVCVRVWQRI